jgi:membrane-associated phospholipid phosphatase
MSGTATLWASAISLSTGRIGQTGRMPTTTIAERRPGHAPASRPDRATSPALEPRTTGPAHALASRLRGWHPAIVFVVALVLGYIALAAFAIALGMLLVHVVLPSLGIGSLDERFPAWLSHHRDHALNDASAYGSDVGDIPAIPAIVVLVVIVAAILRRWRVGAFVVAAILVEAATYRVASLIVHRERPTVPRLDHLPANQSYPSGHVAASIAVYAAVALLLTTRFRHRGAQVGVWCVALLLPVVVALSRMYRGMHHPLDVTSGALIGAGAILVALLATRAAGNALENRRPSSASS